MAEPLSADTPQLIAEAANFDRIAGELKAILGYVNGTAATLATQLDSEAAGAAAQAALVRFEEASTSQIQLLNEISANIHQGGVDYDTSDMHSGEALSSQMQI
jgi:uncharacterized protein YukE